MIFPDPSLLWMVLSTLLGLLMNMWTHFCRAFAWENNSLVTGDMIRLMLKRWTRGSNVECRQPPRRLKYLLSYSLCSFLSSDVLPSKQIISSRKTIKSIPTLYFLLPTKWFPIWEEGDLTWFDDHPCSLSLSLSYIIFAFGTLGGMVASLYPS